MDVDLSALKETLDELEYQRNMDEHFLVAQQTQLNAYQEITLRKLTQLQIIDLDIHYLLLSDDVDAHLFEIFHKHLLPPSLQVSLLYINQVSYLRPFDHYQQQFLFDHSWLK